MALYRNMHVMIHELHLRHLDHLRNFLNYRHMHLLLHWHRHHLILVLQRGDFHVLLDGLKNGHMFVPRNRDVDVVIHVLKHWDLHGLRHLLDDWDMPLLRDRNINDFVHVLDLRHINGLLHNLLDRDVLNHHLGHLGDVLLDDRPLPLHRPLYDLRLHDLDLLDLILNGHMLHRLRDLRDSDNRLLDHDFRHFNRLLQNDRPWHFHGHLHLILDKLLLGVHNGYVHDLLYSLRHGHVDHMLDVHDAAPLLSDDLRNMHNLLLHDRHRNLDNLLNRLVHDSLLLHHLRDMHCLLDVMRNVDIDDLLHLVVVMPVLADYLRHMNDLLVSHVHWHLH
mmetsp:Transcript_97390/g.231723  ORF Transcript_97390/g.231723 Transcript_97390/m.231723 type:complete len:334 (-) Transcript_97390:1428-2429(-)